MDSPQGIQRMHILLGLVCIALVGLGVAMMWHRDNLSEKISEQESVEVDDHPIDIKSLFADTDAPFEISDTVRAPFSIHELNNLEVIEKEFGVNFSDTEKKHLEEHKFILKPLTDSSLVPISVGENMREYVALYDAIGGSSDIKERTAANAPFVSTDVLMHLFSTLSVELLKETENQYLFPQIQQMTETLYKDAESRVTGTRNADERAQWVKVRNYLAVPHALLSTAIKPPSAEEYWQGDHSESYEEYLQGIKKKDASAGRYDDVVAFVKGLNLDEVSERAVLADVAHVYDAPSKAVPAVFKKEYDALADQDIVFSIPFSLFTVRGTYTSSSLRRQYFRAVQWYQQIPFFTRSPELSTYAVKIGELLQAHQDELKRYEAMNELIMNLVGKSDDLDAGDYAHAVKQLGDDAYDEAARSAFLSTAKPASRIKGMPAFYNSVGVVQMRDVMDATRGMRFFSQKFIPDSYWTGRLTQGDEAPDVDGMKLPRSVSSVQVMTILGSQYAESQLPTLPFYPEHKKAIDTRIDELKRESIEWGPDYWKGNQVTGILSSIATLFSWYQDNREKLPAFMQSPLWGSKTLMTGSGFWTEMRHTNILYAKQSFAEKGGGGDDEKCDTRTIPQAVYGYVEPHPEVHKKIAETAAQLSDIYSSQSIKLVNAEKLKSYIQLLAIAREYSQLQLQDTPFVETSMSKSVPLEKDPSCIQTYVDPKLSVIRDGDERVMNADKVYVSALSRAEELRRSLIDRMINTLPYSVEGPILPIKDKRAGVIADVHTSDEGIVEEGTGVPFLIFVAIKDSNGARLTTGLTYSHYEFLSKDKRLTDEEWQSRFYTDEGGDYQITYKPYSAWPALPVWYQELLVR